MQLIYTHIFLTRKKASGFDMNIQKLETKLTFKVSCNQMHM